MNVFTTILILAAAFLAVFAETVLTAPRHFLGAQVDVLPGLMVFAALNADIVTVCLLAIMGGLWFDALSANPLGITIIPLMVIGFPIHLQRDLILRGLPFAQLMLGAAASVLVPSLTLLFLLNSSHQPLVGWGTIWQLIVMTTGGALATPFSFSLLGWGTQALGYKPRVETSFRSDREIQRGRKK